MKGSTARHDDATHMQLPGTIKFQNNPKKEGEVTGGTSTDESGFAKLCVEFSINEINYSYTEKETLDILIDFERD